MKLTREVRHLEGIKANFAVRSKEYVGIASLKKGSLLQEENQLLHTQSHIIYSNVAELQNNSNISLIAFGKSREVVVSVRDNGAGIDPEVIPKLFTKFTTWPSSISRTNGIGLGLFISKNIIEAHGGSIWAKNNSTGKGATFSFSLPWSNQYKNITPPF